MPVPFQAVRRRTLKSLASCAHVPLKGQKKKKVKMLKGRRETAGDGWPPACKNRDPSFSSHAVNAAAFWILPRLYTRLGLRPFFKNFFLSRQSAQRPEPGRDERNSRSHPVAASSCAQSAITKARTGCAREPKDENLPIRKSRSSKRTPPPPLGMHDDDSLFV